MVSERIAKPNILVIERAGQKFASQCNFAVSEQNSYMAASLYEDALRYPCTSTLKQSDLSNYHLNGPVFGLPGLYHLYIDDEPTDFVCKTCKETEYRRGQVLFGVLKYNPCPNLTSGEVRDLISTEAGDNHKYVMIMPFYGFSIEVRPFGVQLLHRLHDDMMTALNHLHSLGFAHMDVKPANICLGNNRFVLIDIGSTVPFGNRTDSTVAYLTSEHLEKYLSNGLVASASVDFWMLAIVLWEKSPNSPITPGLGAVQPEKSVVVKGLQDSGLEFLRQYATFLTTEHN